MNNQRTPAQVAMDNNKINAIAQQLKDRVYASEYMFVKVVSSGFMNGKTEPSTTVDVNWVKMAESVAKLQNAEQYQEAIKTLASIEPEILKQLLSTVMTFGYKTANQNLQAYSEDLKNACAKAGVKLGA